MSPTPELPLNIDSTMIAAFRQCPQKFYQEFVLGLRPSALSIDLHAGACFASALENVYRGFYVEGLSAEKAQLRAFAQFMEQWGDFVSMKETPKSRERVWDAVEAYFRVFGIESDHVKPHILDGKPCIEFTFGIPLLPTTVQTPTIDELEKILQEEGNDKVSMNSDGSIRVQDRGFPLHPSGSPFIYSGRFDLLGKWGDKLVIRDEKTTTSIGNSWAGQWDLRSQFMGYCWGCQQSGLDVDTVCVRGVGILKTKITVGPEAEAFKTYSAFKIARWHEQLRHDLWRIRRAWDSGYWDFNLADACSAYGGCAFKDLCSSEHPERWHDQFVVRRWNPIQKNPIEEKAA